MHFIRETGSRPIKADGVRGAQEERNMVYVSDRTMTKAMKDRKIKGVWRVHR